MDLEFLFKNLGLFLVSVILLLLAAMGIVRSASFFADYLGFSLVLIGILITGLGNSLPEAFFSAQAARKGENWLALGDLMGGVVVASTLVLGTVAMIHPIRITDFSVLAIGRLFLVIAAVFFLIFLRTGKKITKKEAIFLIFIYLAFIVTEILLK